LCGCILTVLSYIVIILTLPFSLFFCIEMVQEYERAVIFRLGRILSGGARGPGELLCGRENMLVRAQGRWIFRELILEFLGRILNDDSEFAGIFFIVPCIDTTTKVDLRLVTFDVPPQEVSTILHIYHKNDL
uniref:Podocin (inferred by orthology to a human protein) n=1 Tax=Anisakis simplex TaxID=6269 RepID=A0A0M3JEV4_ANISI